MRKKKLICFKSEYLEEVMLFGAYYSYRQGQIMIDNIIIV